MGQLRAIWRFRGFILGSVRREFKDRYQGSLLGRLWLVLNPLAMILVYTLVFSEVMKARLPGMEGSTFGYSIYLCAGVLTWGLFADLVTRLQTVFISNSNLIKKVSFPRTALPVIATLASLASFAIILVLFLTFLAVTGNFPGLPVVAIVPLLLVQLIFSIGLGLLLGVLNVFVRDIGQATGVVLQFWFWLTPIVYTSSIVPERFRLFLEVNPMWPLISAYQTIFVRGDWPDFGSIFPVCVAGLALLVLAGAMFRRVAGELVDDL